MFCFKIIFPTCSLSPSLFLSDLHLHVSQSFFLLSFPSLILPGLARFTIISYYSSQLWKAYSPTSPLLIQHQRFVSKCATRSSSATPSANVFTSSTPSTPVKHMVNEATPSRKRPFSSAMPVIDTRVYLLCPAGRTLGIRARRARVDDFLLLSASGWATGGGLAGCVILSTLRPTTLVVVVDIAVF